VTGCGRQWCTKCGEETIHRDNRKRYESASCLGQIMWREGPMRLTAGDLDLLTRKGLRNGKQLLLGLEQKQPGHKFDLPQERSLRLLDGILRHCGLCPAAADLELDPRSGVYIVRGPLGAATEGRRKTGFLGPQQIEWLSTGRTVKVPNHETFFRFVDPEDWERCRTRDEDRESGLPHQTHRNGGESSTRTQINHQLH